MKNSLIPFAFLFFISCTGDSKQVNELKNEIDSLQARLANAYKPGLGEFMTNIQVHHAKLWFAGQNKNWKLADFEIHEIREALGDIQRFETDRKEVKEIGLITPYLDSMDKVIRLQDPAGFNHQYQVLTESCNTCHRAVDFEFNRVKVPDSPPFSNQDFTAPNE